MAIFIVENSGKVSYGIKRYVCKTMADIPVEVNGEEIAPGSKVYVSDEKKTYMLNTAGQWVEITEGGGGGANALSDLTDVDISGSVQGGKVLKYNAVEEKWAPGDDAGNVQSDWNENDSSSGAYILNKPSIPNAPIELTQAEYDALTPAEKMSDTPYLITDANGDGSQFQPVIYSTTEREIGIWTDGKPLYEKTVSATIENSSAQILSTIYNAEYKSIEGFFSAPSGIVPVPFNDGTSRYVPYTDGDDIKLAKSSASQGVGNTIVLTIQYTKSTDVPGSGIWTPQGIPAVHYSTDERIIGTWIDGTPVYEKTFIGQMASGSSKCDIPFTGFGENQAVLSINGLFDGAIPFDMHGAKSSYISITSLHQYANYGYWGSAGIRVSRNQPGLYSRSPNVVVTVQYLKNI